MLARIARVETRMNGTGLVVRRVRPTVTGSISISALP